MEPFLKELILIKAAPAGIRPLEDLRYTTIEILLRKKILFSTRRCS